MFRRRWDPSYLWFFDGLRNCRAEPRHDDSKRESYSWRNFGRSWPCISETRFGPARLIRKSVIVKGLGEGDVPSPRLMQARLQFPFQSTARQVHVVLGRSGRPAFPRCGAHSGWAADAKSNRLLRHSSRCCTLWLELFQNRRPVILRKRFS
jgi:hypothetical protein